MVFLTAGGVVESVKLLLDKGANPNCKGHFGRTPLYRAAFAGHLEATQVHLEFVQSPAVHSLSHFQTFLKNGLPFEK